MKYPKHLGRFTWINKRSRYELGDGRLIFYPDECRAVSYGWYRLLDKIDGKIVLNVFNYSKTTMRHVGNIRSALASLEMNIYLEIKAPRGLQYRNDAIHLIDSEIDDLKELISRPRSRQANNAHRYKMIELLTEHKKKYVELVNGETLSSNIDALLQDGE